MEFVLYIDHKLAATEYRAMKAKDLAKAVIEADAIFDPETMNLVQIMKKRRERENVENGVKACTFRAVLEKYSTKWVAASLTKYVIAKFERSCVE